MKKQVVQGKKVEPSAKTARAVARYLRISPRKVRLVIDTIRYQPTERAFHILTSLKQKAARMTEKLLKSAVANAKGLGLEENRLCVSAIYADGGPTFKRFIPRSMGRADRILKRTTHLSIVLKEGQKAYPKSVETAHKEAKEAAGPKGKKKTAKAGSGKS